MSHPFRQYLQVSTDSTGDRLQCTRCLHVLCPGGEDWKKVCERRTFPPTKAGPLMDVLAGRYVLQKLYCPSCGALFDSEMVEADPEDKNQKGKPEGRDA